MNTEKPGAYTLTLEFTLTFDPKKYSLKQKFDMFLIFMLIDCLARTQQYTETPFLKFVLPMKI